MQRNIWRKTSTDQEIYQGSKRCKIKHVTKNLHRKKYRSKRLLDFSLKCIADKTDNLKIEFAKSLQNTSDEEVSRLNKEQPKQLNKFEEVIRIVKEILESASVCPMKERKIQRIITHYEELTALKGDHKEKLNYEISKREIDKHQLFK